MVAPFAVLGLVVDDAVGNFYFSRIEIALEICRVVICVPQAKFNERENRKMYGRIAQIRQRELPDFEVIVEWDKVANRRADALRRGRNNRVAESMAAGIIVERGLCWLPRQRPKYFGVIIA
jgi:hypothetical protein